MSGDEEQSERGFKVQDRRRFVETDSATADRVEAPVPESPASADAGASEPSSSPSSYASADEMVEMTFSTFVISLSTQALMHLGEIPDPIGKVPTRDLPAAKQMIDLLGILSDKTKGNLDSAEEQLLGSMLYDLRMRYVEMVRQR